MKQQNYERGNKKAPLSDKKLRRRNVFITALFLIVTLLFVLLFLIKWRVRSITIIGTDRIPDVAVLDAIDVRFGTHMCALNADKIAREAQNASPYIRTATVKRGLSTELSLYVREYVPRYYWEGEDGFWILSEELVALEWADTREEALSLAGTALLLPETEEIRSGAPLVFRSKELQTRIPQILQILAASPIASELDTIDLRSRFDIRATLQKEKYTLLFGSTDALTEKLKHVAQTLTYLDENMPQLRGILRIGKENTVSFEIVGVAD